MDTRSLSRPLRSRQNAPADLRFGAEKPDRSVLFSLRRPYGSGTKSLIGRLIAEVDRRQPCAEPPDPFCGKINACELPLPLFTIVVGEIEAWERV